MPKRIIALLLFVIMLLTGCTQLDNNSTELLGNTPSPTPTEKAVYKLPDMSIMVMKIGKADAIIIENSGHIMMIDTGDKDNESRVSAYLRDRRIGKIDYLILTHLDKDHIGGAAKVLANMEVNKIYQSNNNEKSDEYKEYTEACEKYGVEPVLLDEVVEFEFAGAGIKLLPAEKSKYKNDNDYSIMTEITYGEKRFLFAGDAMDERLEEYLGGKVEPFDYVKIPHHGRYCEKMDEFIKKTAPGYSVITCSEKNPPDNEVIKLLQEVDSTIYLTVEKFVSAVCNGVDLKVS